MSRRILASSFPLLLAAIQLSSQTSIPSGVIRGTVVNEDSEPVAGADVRVNCDTDESPGSRLVRYVQTDGAGRFVMGGLKPGRYSVFAKKESDGYPYSGYGVYAVGAAPTADVSAASPTADVQVRIGPKAATVVLSISDAVTGKPLSPAVRIWRWTEERVFMSTEVHSPGKVLIPARIEVGLEVSEPGYQTWQYCGPSGQPAPLNLFSGSTLALDVKLQPVPK
jgi:hypothetical protein